jgi:hypothetical protein
MLRFQDHIATATENAANEVFRYARAVPDDKLDWVPVEGGRSVLDICRELAMTPTWAIDTISGGGQEYHEGDPEVMMAKLKEMQAAWTTVEHCETECRRRLSELTELFRSTQDEKLSETRWLPYEGGRDFTMVEMFDYARWNFNYHLGQIAFVQLCYGDRQMY